MSFVSTTVTKAELVAPDVIFLKLARPEGMKYKAGQFTSLGLNINGKRVFRLYSIASVPSSETVDFFVTNRKGGMLSPRLNALKDGDAVDIETRAAGTLMPSLLNPGGKYLWLLSSGTGVAPFMGLVQDESLMNSFERVILVHGARTWEDTQYVSRLIRRSPNLRMMSCVTREKDAYIAKRVPAALSDGTLEKIAGAPLSPETSRVMLCGNPGMITGTLEVLAAKGFQTGPSGEPGRVLVENFGI